MTLQGMSPPMSLAPTTGDAGAVLASSSVRLMRSRLPMLDIAYWPPGIARFPVSSQTSFSR